MLDHSSKVQVFLADAVIANWISRDREPTEYGEPKKFDILRSVLVLNGYAAKILEDHCFSEFASENLRWPECK